MKIKLYDEFLHYLHSDEWLTPQPFKAMLHVIVFLVFILGVIFILIPDIIAGKLRKGD